MSEDPKQKRTFKDSDQLHREDFGKILTSFMRTEHIIAEDSFVVALTGGFGSGKTHFLEMWEAEMATKADSPLIVHINAWESDFSGEPVLAIVSAISRQITKAHSTKENLVSGLKSAAAKLATGTRTVVAELASGYIEEKTGINPANALKAAKEGGRKEGLNKSACDLFSTFEARMDAVGNLRLELAKLIEYPDQLSLIVVVDELDRCRPNYAIEFLEALKHFFNIRGMGVLLAVDWDQLSCTARAMFGNDLNTIEYFRKFVTRTISLPDPDFETIRQYFRVLWQRIFQSEVMKSRKRFVGVTADEGLDADSAAILCGLGVTKPRQLEEIFRTLSHFFSTEMSSQCHPGSYRFFVISIFVLSLKISDPDKYVRILNGTIGADDVTSAIDLIMRQNYGNYHFQHLWDILFESFIDKTNSTPFENAYKARLASKGSSPQYESRVEFSRAKQTSSAKKLADGIARASNAFGLSY